MVLLVNGEEATLSEFCDDDLRRSVFNSLFSWARADDSDELPADSKEGWWGDAYADIEGDRFGSKLWLLSRSKVTSEVILLAQSYAEEALAWLVTDGIAKTVTVTAEESEPGALTISAAIQKPASGELLNMRFQDIWG